MRITFEEVISGIHFHEGELVDFDYYQKEIVLELMKAVRISTINECADNAEADVNIFRNSQLQMKAGEDYEVYILKESILQLDKNSIEV